MITSDMLGEAHSLIERKLLDEALDVLELKVGMWITVLAWKPSRTVFGGEYHSHDLVGNLLKIEAIDSPFVVVVIAGTNATNRFVLDLRECELKRLSDDFVKALNGNENLLHSKQETE